MRRIILTVLACCLGAAAVVSASALAGATSSSSGPQKTRSAVRAERQAKQLARTDRVARRLGKTGAELRAARVEARSAALARAVQAGTLTGAQRDAVTACRSKPLTCDRTNLPVRPRRALRGQRRQIVADVAKALGVGVAQLRAAQQAERPAGAGKHRRGHKRTK